MADGEVQVERPWLFNGTVKPRNHLTADAPCDGTSTAITQRVEFPCKCHRSQYFLLGVAESILMEISLAKKWSYPAHSLQSIPTASKAPFYASLR